MTEIDRRHVMVVAAIADTGSITAAALELHLSQSAVSRTLAQAELIVGTSLFDRSTHHVQITEAGSRFLGHGRAALVNLDRAVSSAQPETPPVSLGYTWGIRRLVTELITRWEREAPEIEVVVSSFDDNQPEPELVLSTAGPDIVVIRSRSDQWAHSTVVATEQRWAAVAKDHRFIERSSVSIGELCDEPLVLAQGGTTSLDLWPPHQRPQIIVHARTIDDWFVEIAAGHGNGITVDSIALQQLEHDVHFVPIQDAPPIDILVALVEPVTHPHSRILFEIASKTVATPSRQARPTRASS